MPLGFHDPIRHSEDLQHVLVAPAGRVEAIITGPRQRPDASLRTRCVDTGPDGDPNPAMVIADLDLNAPPAAPKAKHSPLPTGIASHPISETKLREVENDSPGFVVKFTEDKQGFYINGKKYGPNGSADECRLYREVRTLDGIERNCRDSSLPQLHQVHFLVYANNGRRSEDAIWMDTVNVPSPR